jgi:hypothetical protein
LDSLKIKWVLKKIWRNYGSFIGAITVF